jgi:hypothetical protein
MTTKNEYTKGKWEAGTTVIDNLGKHIAVALVDNPHKIIALTGFVGADDEIESIANAELICALVNAAQEIGEPMKVAENLKAMHDTLRLFSDYLETPYPKNMILKKVAAEKLESVLSAIEEE